MNPTLKEKLIKAISEKELIDKIETDFQRIVGELRHNWYKSYSDVAGEYNGEAVE